MQPKRTSDRSNASAGKVTLSRSDENSKQMKYCQRIIKQFFWKKNRSFAWPFIESIDTTSLAVSRAHDLVPNSMNLDEIRRKFEEGHYASPHEVRADVMSIYEASSTCHPPCDPVRLCAEKLWARFENMWEKMPASAAPQPEHRQDVVNVSSGTGHRTAAVMKENEAEMQPDSSYIQGYVSSDHQFEEIRFALEAEQLKLQEKVDVLRSCWDRILSLKVERLKARAVHAPVPVLSLDEIRAVRSVLSNARSLIDSTCPLLDATQSNTVPTGHITSTITSTTKVFYSEEEIQISEPHPQDHIGSPHERQVAEISRSEKLQLLRDLSTLSQDKTAQLVDIITTNESIPCLGSNEELEFDFEKLRSTTLRKMQVFVANCLSDERANDEQGQSAQINGYLRRTPRKRKRINAIGKNSKEMKQRRSLLSPRYRQTALEVYPSNATREEDHKRAVFASYIHKGAKPLLTTAPEGPLSVECCILDRLLPLQHSDKGRRDGKTDEFQSCVGDVHSSTQSNVQSAGGSVAKDASEPMKRRMWKKRQKGELEEGECASDSSSEIVDLTSTKHQPQRELMRRREQERRRREAMTSTEVVTRQMDVE
uniref:NET domain-containing protein n=2 Tax=Parascaris univalens TaxID=6257 RepID=A0A914ZY57_PARUN